MTPEQFKRRMSEIYKDARYDEAFEEYVVDNVENAHRAADRLMCKALEDLGYGEGIDLFRKMPKWYA